MEINKMFKRKMVIFMRRSNFTVRNYTISLKNSASATYLSHHGIEGQRWGVRNGPPYPLNGHSRQVHVETKEISSKKSFYLTDKQKKVLIIGASVVGTSLIIYGGYKLSKQLNLKTTIDGLRYVDQLFSETNIDGSNYVNGVLKKGSTLQTLAKESKGFDKSRSTYFSFTKSDNEKYLRTLGQKPEYKYKVKMTTLKDLKIASQEDGSKVFSKMFKNDPLFREYIQIQGRGISTDRLTGTKGLLFKNPHNLTDSEVNRLYSLWNTMLPNKGPKMDVFKDKFFNELKSLGFDGLLDLNDKLYSDIQAENPILLFDLSSVLINSIKNI